MNSGSLLCLSGHLQCQEREKRSKSTLKAQSPRSPFFSKMSPRWVGLALDPVTEASGARSCLDLGGWEVWREHTLQEKSLLPWESWAGSRTAGRSSFGSSQQGGTQGLKGRWLPAVKAGGQDRSHKP